MKAVASELDCGMGRSKIAVRAEISIGTVTFIHCLAATELASRANVEIESPNILVKVSGCDRICVTRIESPKSWCHEIGRVRT